MVAGASMRYLVILMAFCLQACGGASSESEFERLVRETGCTTASQVYRDYQRNEVAAQQKYQGRVNRVCGIVDEIELNIINKPVISLKASGWGVVSIGGIDPASAAQMSKGSPAVFECSGINELLGNPVLTECVSLTNLGGGADTTIPVPNVEDRNDLASAAATASRLHASCQNGDNDACSKEMAVSQNLKSNGMCQKEIARYVVEWVPCSGGPMPRSSDRTDYIKGVVDGTIEMPDSFYENLSCDELWYARNYIYSEAGFCFKTSRAISTFGKACFAPYGKLNDQQKTFVDQISGAESSFCR